MLQQRPVHLPPSFPADDTSLITLCLGLQELSLLLFWRLGQEQERESRRCPLGHSVWDREGSFWGLGGHLFILLFLASQTPASPCNLMLITLPPALILEQSSFPRPCVAQLLCSRVWVSQCCSWVLSQCLQITWGLAKENEHSELNSAVAFPNRVFARNRKSDKLGGKLPSA